MSRVVDGARALGVELSALQLAQLDRLQAALLDWNQRLNLTRITDPQEIETRHFVDSLTAAIPLLDRLQAGEPIRLIDVGTGAGFPGLPIKIAFPAVRLTLLESVRKKAAYLDHVVEALALEGVDVVVERAEVAGRDPAHRDAYGWATARALGSLPVVVELCAPFLEQGGLLVAHRKGRLERELLAAAPAFSALKLWARAPIPIELPGLADGRGLIVGEKYAPTPTAYPRPKGRPAKRPLA